MNLISSRANDNGSHLQRCDLELLRTCLLEGDSLLRPGQLFSLTLSCISAGETYADSYLESQPEPPRPQSVGVPYRAHRFPVTIVRECSLNSLLPARECRIVRTFLRLGGRAYLTPVRPLDKHGVSGTTTSWREAEAVVRAGCRESARHSSQHPQCTSHTSSTASGGVNRRQRSDHGGQRQ